ncbi:cytochrome C oxidase subunit IV family protein [Noviherbaspirillum massiliense]|uniref:cytochrome C oxidase subunit IV family protein n=1 Tax=Noviherbaspirillum massiliense TaxID=1465823 RepID=UPI001FE096D3|nr:cytochrome C oxidase subunit IV family protein [Noviherbaspirillum massiliense]
MKRYLLVWVCLMVLLMLTCGSAFLHLGAWNSIINLAIAVVKALLIALFFMHLRSSRALVRLLAVTALATLALLFVLSGSDYATRTLYPAPWQSPQQLQPEVGQGK